MNRTYRSIWNHSKQAYVAAGENVAASGKPTSSSVALLAPVLCSLSLVSGMAAAADLPTGGNVVAGTGSIATSGNQMTINQSTNKLAIDWQSFSIGAGKTVEFVQPSSSAVALNRVLGTDVSVIQGALKANGQVFLVNPNGVLFSKDAQVNVGGIVASTLNIKTDDFLAGNYRFEGASSNAIVNQGNITAAPGGTVALIAARITNTGQINAERGNVLMGAGSKVKLDLGGPVKIEVEQGAIDALIEQGGGIRADGGLVYLTAKAVGQLVTTVINHTGITEARTLATGEKGEIYLMGGMDKDRIVVGGRLDASAPNGGEGGFIETSAHKVKINDDAAIRAGQWLIDPYDFTVASSGGDITGSALSTALGAADVTIQTTSSNVSCTSTPSVTCGGGNSSGNGDIFVNDAVTWSSGKKLTLNAWRNIEINAPINASGGSGGKLALEYGQGAAASGNTATYTINAPVNLQDGANFSTTLGSDGTVVDYTVISSPTALAGLNTTLNSNLSGNYALGADLTLTGTGTATNWTSVGSSAGAFTGKFDGLGHTITNLRPSDPPSGAAYWEPVGMFGYTRGAALSNLTLADVVINSSQWNVGSLAGDAYNTQIHNVAVSGSVTSSGGDVGGLVGILEGGRITKSHASSSVTGSYYVGGLVGFVDCVYGSNWTCVGAATIDESWAIGPVTGTREGLGGLVGAVAGNANITRSYAGGDVSGSSSTDGVGGLIGYMYGSLVSVENAYATGKVTGHDDVGGLIGYTSNVAGSSIKNVYASGAVTGGTSRKGGLIGYQYNSTATITNAFWDTATTGQNTSAGYVSGNTDNYTPINSSTAYSKNTYGTIDNDTELWASGFNFDSVWWMANNATRPILRMEHSNTITNAHQLQLMAMDDAARKASYTLANDIDLKPSLSNVSDVWKGGSFSPIGNNDEKFMGSFDGQGNTISHLNIKSVSNVGLFGNTLGKR